VDNKDLIPSKNGDLSDSYYVYSGPAVPTSVGCDNAACRQAHSDLAQWVTQLKAAAPTPVKADGSQDRSALAAVTVDSDKGSLIITSSWNGMSASASGVAQNDSYRFAYHP
jgi:hypothetical protein